MAKSADAFRTISEVAEWLGLPTHVLRFWESKFTQVKPVKRAGGRRYYRPNDMLLLGGIKKLLHDDGMTIKGAQKVLRDHGVKHVAALSQPIDAGAPAEPETTTNAATAPEMIEAHAEPAATAPEMRGMEAPEVEASEPSQDTSASPAPAPQTSETEPPAQDLTEQMPALAPQSSSEEPDPQLSESSSSEPLDAEEDAAITPADTTAPSEDAQRSAGEAEATSTAPSSGLPAFLRQSDSAEELSEPERAPIKANAPEQDMSDTEADVDAGLLTRLAALKAPVDSRMRERLDAARAELQSLSQK